MDLFISCDWDPFAFLEIIFELCLNCAINICCWLSLKEEKLSKYFLFIYVKLLKGNITIGYEIKLNRLLSSNNNLPLEFLLKFFEPIHL